MHKKGNPTYSRMKEVVETCLAALLSEIRTEREEG